ncbi:MAG: tyrosine-protein phosphatase, partial [Dehalococcoidales bacterium]|nr:tyrosine-protein phosphatase [Dehalococcoidales bacterium]
EDYALSEPYMDELLARLKNNPQKNDPPIDIPDYFWKASPESMTLFLSKLKTEHGSIASYLKAQGAAPSLVSRLESALLTRD